MPVRSRLVLALMLFLISGRAALAGEAPSGPTIDYDRQVRPILSNTCYKCHGPDAEEREAGLRLDDRAAAIGLADSGEPAIVPGDPERSQLVRRIFAKKEGLLMPPPESNKTLTVAEKQVLKDWVAQGARYQAHWSFQPPSRPAIPMPKEPARAINPIDGFVFARLDAEGLSPRPEADRATLARRLALDLTGLPPTMAELDAFLADDRPDAYNRLVDHYLASPHYGERMALDWLDAARYADTHGYHIDSGRDMTRWRDWVIDAFNRNVPYDQFTVEQLAGDLLPDATLDQKIASGFNRNHMISFEGGAFAEEYRTAYVLDRVNTTGTIWLGLTVACAQCHDHKYDPITQKDYYRLYAFFNSVSEKGLDGSKGNAAPLVKLADPKQQAEVDRLATEIRRVEEEQKKSPEDKALGEQLKTLRTDLASAEAQIPSAMIMQELPEPRDTFMLVRGEYDKPGEKVTPGVPSFLPPLPGGVAPDRLALARWLVDPRNPMVGRVTVNRIWQSFFGTGIVRTSDDLGSQGEVPSHPELLDWLAVEFTTPATPGATPWDVKALVRLIVTSAAYRQHSGVSAPLVARDPENRLLARGPRVRLQAEFLRDQALAVSGLLDGEIGGRSVSPYQPAGLWEELMSRTDGAQWSAQKYVQGHGKDLYRRTMYTFWKRTSPPPSLATFDAPDREVCTVQRARTNTPLQALVLMNDPTYVEAARKLAARVMTEAGSSPDARIALGFRLATARKPNPEEASVLRAIFEENLAVFRQDQAAAVKLLSVGESPRDETLDPAEHAAWATVASVILNLDEVLNKN